MYQKYKIRRYACSVLLWKLTAILYSCTWKGCPLGFKEVKSNSTSLGTMPFA